ncbi:MAG: RNA methyltransferase [Flavobacteriaceae bacterium]
MYKQISSLQNPLIKQVIQLTEKSRERKKHGLFVVEGQREISLANKGGYTIETLLFCAEIIPQEALSTLQKTIEIPFEIIQVSKEVYEKIAYRSSTEGVIALCKSKDLQLSALQFHRENPLILVAEAPEKPGNIGALLRTADAAKVDAVIIANPKTDLFNPNIIRSSVGCVFTNQVATGSTSEIIAFLKDKHIPTYCAALQASKNYYECDFTQAAAIVVGTEDDGLTEEWLQNSSQNIIIPMQGEIDSMNVSVAAGILIFEAKRQRNFS